MRSGRSRRACMCMLARFVVAVVRSKSEYSKIMHSAPRSFYDIDIVNMFKRCVMFTHLKQAMEKFI